MRTEFVNVVCDLYCTRTETPPRYRMYVNDELFTERTWIWDNVYLEENLQVQAPPGRYTVALEIVQPTDATIVMKNIRVDKGSGRINKQGFLEVWHEIP